MSINKLKSIVRRGTMFGAVFAVVAATFAPASLTFADALNPLTDRSLTLSSSSPGWDYKDGSGNTTYAQPNSGANGKQTGNTFAFKVSSTATIKGFTFQYCTTSAGNCLSPGNQGFTGSSPSATRTAATATTADLNVVTGTGTGNVPAEVDNSIFSDVINTTDVNGTPKRSPVGIPNIDNSQGNFLVMYWNGSAWAQSTGWSMTASNVETGDVAHATGTGKNNFIKLVNSTGQSLSTTTPVKVIFFGTNTNYLTNPGAGAFFVKINDYNDNTTLDSTTLVDGGVTVANVMNQSIQIQTKVLETMDFSVGTVDPYTLSDAQLVIADPSRSTHGQCDPILKTMTPGVGNADNSLDLGDQVAENSLRTDKTYSTHSYWRLSSNSSAGATVYYSGVTLKNTVGDEIAPIGTAAAFPSRGTPQFGLAIANGSVTDESTTPTGHAVNYSVEETAGKVYENGADKNANTQGVDASVATDTALLTGYHAPKLAPLAPYAQYDQGAGIVNPGGADYGGSAATAKFAFDPTSNTIPTPIASESSSVVDCVTAKIRYIANIAATTPAGIYTTKINYIAAPQY
ncbi:MAG: hypothetical protein JWN12_393 [Candidatus Saccharibacteria bacterium]|nr:hypothetical protein [Candidatus Saccharibacteria bacterium]